MTILAFFAHPDDEAYSAAGTLAQKSDAGERVVVVSATRGEGGRDRQKSGVPLGELRTRELEASCAIIGAEARFLDLRDGRVAPQIAEGVMKLQALIDELAPTMLITHGGDGAYGHVDHIACAAIVTEVSFSGPVLHAAFPKGLFAPMHRALRKALPGVIANVPLGSEHFDEVVELDEALQERKLASIAAHASQLDRGDPQTLLGRGIVAATLACERFTR